ESYYLPPLFLLYKKLFYSSNFISILKNRIGLLLTVVFQSVYKFLSADREQIVHRRAARSRWQMSPCCIYRKCWYTHNLTHPRHHLHLIACILHQSPSAYSHCRIRQGSSGTYPSLLRSKIKKPLEHLVPTIGLKYLLYFNELWNYFEICSFNNYFMCI